MKILLVEDEHHSQQAMSALLQGLGYEVRAADSGEAASALLSQAFRPDLLVSDWMLRGVEDGIDVARKALGVNPQLGLVFITGQSVEDLKKAAADLPPAGFLTKPFGFGELAQAIQEAAGSARRHPKSPSLTAGGRR